MTLQPADRNCGNCGRSIPAQTEFCPHCGARNDPPQRSVVTVLLDWLVTGLVLLLTLLFGLAGLCFLLFGTGGMFGREALGPIAFGIGLLLVAAALVRYLQRRRQTKQ